MEQERQHHHKTKDTIVKIADQNDDGEFNMQDITEKASKVNSATRKTVSNIKDSLDERSRELDKKTLMPIFSDTIDDTGFSLSKLIRITDVDKRRADSKVCQGSIGYITPQTDFNVINIYKDNL